MGKKKGGRRLNKQMVADDTIVDAIGKVNTKAHTAQILK